MGINYTSGKTSPQKILVGGFIGIIILGTVLLLLPYSTTHGITPVDSLFTSASAVCVTGLIVKDTLNDFTLPGKIIILVLIQIGGLGYMSMATFIALLAGRKIGIPERIMIKESLNIGTLEGIVRFMKGMLVFVFLSESIGAVALTLHFMQKYQLKESLIQGIFHSISAFNNAGFSLFSGNLVMYRNDPGMNITIIILIILGGIGFIVINDVYGFFRGQNRRLMIHTRIVLVSTLFLILGGAFLIYFNERKYLFAGGHFETGSIVLSSIFASVTARTAGFNTIDYALLQPATLFLTILLMVVGASPGSTGGGIKTTTISVIILHLWSTIRGKKDTVVFKRRVPEVLISRSLVVLSIAIFYICIVTILIIDLEHTPFLPTLFETVSAFGTVGLSMGDGGARSFSAGFSNISKVIIIITMLAGRLGPLTLFMALLRQREERVRYPEGRIMIG